MAKSTPKEAYDTYAQTIKARLEKIRKGVRSVDESPGVKAARQQEKMRANLVKSIDDGTWADRVASVTREEWIDKMENVGIPNISRGVDNAQPKMIQFFGQLFEHQDRIVSELKNMPSVSKEDNRSRMNHNFDRMSEFKFKRGR